ncbi:hypothetical protein ABPG74_001357 [Tetrahymena malaccensis]
MPESTQFTDLYEILLGFKGILVVELNLESLFNGAYLEEKFINFDNFNEFQSFQIDWAQIAQKKYFPIIKEEEKLEDYLKCYQKKYDNKLQIMENKIKEQQSKIENQEKIIFENNKIIQNLFEQLDAKSQILNQINFKGNIHSQKSSETFNNLKEMNNEIKKSQQKQINNNNKEPGFYCKTCKFVNKYIYEDYEALIYYCNVCSDFTEHIHFQ